VFTAHRLCVSPNSRLENDKEEEEAGREMSGWSWQRCIPLLSEKGTLKPVRSLPGVGHFQVKVISSDPFPLGSGLAEMNRRPPPGMGANRY